MSTKFIKRTINISGILIFINTSDKRMRVINFPGNLLLGMKQFRSGCIKKLAECLMQLNSVKNNKIYAIYTGIFILISTKISKTNEHTWHDCCLNKYDRN